MSIIVYQRLDNKDIILAADGMVVSGSEIQEPDKHKAFYLLSDMRMQEYDRYIACGFTGDGSLIEFFKRNAGIYFCEKEYKTNDPMCNFSFHGISVVLYRAFYSFADVCTLAGNKIGIGQYSHIDGTVFLGA